VSTLLQVRRAATRGATFGRLIRPDAARLPLVVFLGASVRTQPGGVHVVGGALLILAAYGAAAAYNDLHDREIDRANGRDLPLVTGALAASDVRRACAGCAIAAAVAQGLLVQPAGLVVTLVAAALAGAYSHPLVAVERRGAWATALLALAYVGLPLALAGPLPSAPRTVAALIACAAMLLYKDVRDETGDRALGKRTPLVRWGIDRLDRVAGGLLLGAVALAAATAALLPATVLVAALFAQRSMAATGRRVGGRLRVLQLLVVAGVIALAAV
jgi:4-hydroxybenzoate polyprenyltransferase